VGRNAVSVTGARNTAVNRGSYSGAGLWVFDVEPFSSWSVDGLMVSSATVGMSGGPWLNAMGPDFNCAVTNVGFSSTNRTGASAAPPTVNACVASQITVT